VARGENKWQLQLAPPQKKKLVKNFPLVGTLSFHKKLGLEISHFWGFYKKE